MNSCSPEVLRIVSLDAVGAPISQVPTCKSERDDLFVTLVNLGQLMQAKSVFDA